MRILGIDQSYKSSGLVILEDDNLIHAECYKSNSEDDNFKRCYTISRYIATLAEEWEIDSVFIEGMAYSARGDVTRDLAGLLYAIVIKMNIEKKYKMEIVPPLALKKFGCGYGFAKKAEMINSLPESIRDHFLSLGYKKTTGLADLTDAYYLAQYHNRVWG